MTIFLKKIWPLLVTLFLLLVAIAIQYIISTEKNHGQFGYTNDDVYIHMAVAKNIVNNGVWGIDKYEFASATSSPLWVLLLSIVYFFFGVSDLSPFLMNLAFLVLFVCAAYFILEKYALTPYAIIMVLLSILFFPPFIPLVFGGMEHILHAFFTLLFVILSAQVLSEEKEKWDKAHFYLLALALVLTSVRYEGLFLVFIVCILFLFRRQYRYAVVLGLVSLLPMLIFGLISMHHGWYFLPSSVLLKGNTPERSWLGMLQFLHRGYWALLANIHLLILLFTSAVLYIYGYLKHRNYWKEPSILLLCFFLTMLLHLLFAKTGFHYRYDAYLVSFGIFVIAISFWGHLPQHLPALTKTIYWPIYGMLFFILFIIIHPLFSRAYKSFAITQRSIKNISDQQHQMGLFLKQYYCGTGVAANDIGKINYMADIKCFDMVGLGTFEVSKAILSGQYNTAVMRKLTTQNDIKIAIVYPAWFEVNGGLPPEWIKVGTWTITGNITCGADSVSFYAIDPEARNGLIRNLGLFSSNLPQDVKQSGMYLNQ